MDFASFPWSRLFPPEVLVLGGRVGDFQGDLLDSEQAIIAGAAPSRQREFTASRTLARRALATLDIHQFPLLPDENRCPRWPEGIAGSITHTADYCLVAIGRQNLVGSIGLDLEQVERITPSLWEKIMTQPEREWVRTQKAEEQTRAAALIFSGKEAFYKFQYPINHRFLGFQEVQITPDNENSIIVRVGDSWPIIGRYSEVAGFVITAFSGSLH